MTSLGVLVLDRMSDVELQAFDPRMNDIKSLVPRRALDEPWAVFVPRKSVVDEVQ